jgi:hypothetical protein
LTSLGEVRGKGRAMSCGAISRLNKICKREIDSSRGRGADFEEVQDKRVYYRNFDERTRPGSKRTCANEEQSRAEHGSALSLQSMMGSEDAEPQYGSANWEVWRDDGGVMECNLMFTRLKQYKG